ncbi:hypothetical protein [Leptospira interrogans]|uniref:hypothetical protein n=1 Tax=Leptospira interrogans TaxID=173 RepID=UPI0002974FAA|nr:hypothetical protein [Leptospira interrogans]EKR17341.1 hypothetical protein LEP1GSC019_0098 [Leptospira interrogans serovar Pyrogenes str. 2006006960]MBE0302138.1 hypothetical protein [Leptospira interrogans serovar Yeoncheon]
MKKTEKENSYNRKKPTLLDIYRRTLRPKFIIPFFIMYGSILFLLTEIYGKEILVNEFVLKHGTKITLTLVIVISMGFLISAMYSLIKSERNFYDVDLNAKIETNEKLKEILNLEIEKVKKLQNKSNKLETDLKRKSERVTNIEVSAYDDFKDFYSTTASLLIQKSNLSDEKASILLDKGISFTKFGIALFIFSIIAWQIVASFVGFTQQVIFGILSSSFLFIFIEFLSAWFLKQYKSFTDTSTYMLKIKALLDRYMFAFLVIEKFPNTSARVSNAELILKIIEKEIRWPDSKINKENVDNYAGDVINILSELIKTVRLDGSKIQYKK